LHLQLLWPVQLADEQATGVGVGVGVGVAVAFGQVTPLTMPLQTAVLLATSVSLTQVLLGQDKVVLYSLQFESQT
jgi:hypothetical protein